MRTGKKRNKRIQNALQKERKRRRRRRRGDSLESANLWRNFPSLYQVGLYSLRYKDRSLCIFISEPWTCQQGVLLLLLSFPLSRKILFSLFYYIALVLLFAHWWCFTRNKFGEINSRTAILHLAGCACLKKPQSDLVVCHREFLALRHSPQR